MGINSFRFALFRTCTALTFDGVFTFQIKIKKAGIKPAFAKSKINYFDQPPSEN
jgi:hypothetical protein